MPVACWAAIRTIETFLAAAATPREEHRAKELLVQLRNDVFAHTEHEERGESPMLRAHHPPERLRAMTATAPRPSPPRWGGEER